MNQLLLNQLKKFTLNQVEPINVMVDNIVLKCLHVKKQHISWDIVRIQKWMEMAMGYHVKSSGAIKMETVLNY